MIWEIQSSVGGVMVSIVAFQAMDPGSIPGRRTLLFFLLNKVEIFGQK